MKPGDYIIYPTADHTTHIWQISGVYYGALGQESVVGLKSVARNSPVAHGKDIDEMFVPVELVQDYVFQREAGSGHVQGTPSDD